MSVVIYIEDASVTCILFNLNLKIKLRYTTINLSQHILKNKTLTQIRYHKCLDDISSIYCACFKQLFT